MLLQILFILIQILFIVIHILFILIQIVFTLVQILFISIQILFSLIHILFSLIRILCVLFFALVMCVLFLFLFLDVFFVLVVVWPIVRVFVYVCSCYPFCSLPCVLNPCSLFFVLCSWPWSLFFLKFHVLSFLFTVLQVCLCCLWVFVLAGALITRFDGNESVCGPSNESGQQQ